MNGPGGLIPIGHVIVAERYLHRGRLLDLPGGGELAEVMGYIWDSAGRPKGYQVLLESRGAWVEVPLDAIRDDCH
jgi:hypothetical protein